MSQWLHIAAQDVSDARELLSDFTSCSSTSACDVLVTEINAFVVYSMYGVPFSMVSQFSTASLGRWSCSAVFSVLSLASSAMQAQPDG